MRAAGIRAVEQTEAFAGGAVTVGSDLLSLLSTAMYVEPLTVYREYIQNAVDAVDEVRRAGSIGPDEDGLVEIAVNPLARSVRIRDNGAGVTADRFGVRMRALGASVKRGAELRGFRGVGRLSGLAYAQRLSFRSRAAADEPVMEIVWDCKRLRAGLKQGSDLGLADFMEEITAVRELEGEWPERFFEVEMEGVVRQGDDRLLRPEAVSDYLAQVAPVPFNPSFSLSDEIGALLGPHIASHGVSISVNGGEPLTRPHRDLTDAGAKQPIALRELATFEIPGLDGGLAAVGWVAHHDYDGAIPRAAMVKGLRARVGDIQVGGSALLQDVFPEPRFCAWTVGEVHVLDARIVPNGRRDDFERNGHYANLLNHLAPIGRDVARRCRTNSAQRQWLRGFESQAAIVEQQLGILEQSALGSEAATDLARSIGVGINRLEKLAGPDDLVDETRAGMRARVWDQRARLAALVGSDPRPSILERLPGHRAEIYREIIDLVYECSANRVAGKALVDRILARIAERN